MATPMAARNPAPSTVLTHLSNELTQFHGLLDWRVTPQAALEAIEEAHRHLMAALRILRESEAAHATADARAMTPPPF